MPATQHQHRILAMMNRWTGTNRYELRIAKAIDES